MAAVKVLVHSVLQPHDVQVPVSPKGLQAGQDVAGALESDRLPADIEKPRDVAVVGPQQLLQRPVRRLQAGPRHPRRALRPENPLAGLQFAPGRAVRHHGKQPLALQSQPPHQAAEEGIERGGLVEELLEAAHLGAVGEQGAQARGLGSHGRARVGPCGRVPLTDRPGLRRRAQPLCEALEGTESSLRPVAGANVQPCGVVSGPLLPDHCVENPPLDEVSRNVL